MRTTLNIDDDLLRRLRQESVGRASLRETVNQAIRLGLERMRPTTAVEPYECPSFSLGFPPVPDLHKALRLATQLEDDETTRKLEIGR